MRHLTGRMLKDGHADDRLVGNVLRSEVWRNALVVDLEEDEKVRVHKTENCGRMT